MSATVEIGATDDVVIYTHHRSLHAVDLLTGHTLWRRGDIAADSMLLAGRKRVVIIPPDGGPALVVRAVDGRQTDRQNCRVRVRIFGIRQTSLLFDDNNTKQRDTRVNQSISNDLSYSHRLSPWQPQTCK